MIRSFILIWHVFIVALRLGDTAPVLIGLKEKAQLPELPNGPNQINKKLF